MIEEAEADHVLAVTVNPDKALRTTNQRPVLIHARNRYEEAQAVVHIVTQLLKGTSGFKGFDKPIKSREIGLLYARKDSVIHELKQQLERYAPVVWMSDDSDRTARYRVNEPGLKLQTIHSAKGLQYRVVILLWADQLPSQFANSDEVVDRCLMYVALTRPEDLLVITTSRPSFFVQRIQDSGKIEVRSVQ